MPATLAVTDAEFDAITAAANVSRMIAADSQYQVTDADRAVRARGVVAYAAALQRHNDWHDSWESAGSDSVRAVVERMARHAEKGMKRVPFLKGGRP